MKQVAVGMVMRDGEVLACQRRSTVRYPLKWEFPGGKVEEGETPAEAAVRELREELSIEAVIDREFHRQSWVYPDHARGGSTGAFDVTYLLVRRFTGTPVNHVFETIRWVTPQEFLTMDILEGNREAIERLVRYVAHEHRSPSNGSSAE
jgi:8-oxo-dGTP diphosphatase